MQQAIESAESDKWKAAIQLEYDALIENHTWVVVDQKSVPSGIAIHKPIWRYKIKDDRRYKACLCFDGRFQQAGVDYFDTFTCYEVGIISDCYQHDPSEWGRAEAPQHPKCISQCRC